MSGSAMAGRIALLVPQTDWGWATETLGAYDAWIGEHAAPRLVVPVAMQPGEESAFQATRRLLDDPEPPDAIVVAAARFVRGALRGAKACGRQIPGDLLIAAGGRLPPAPCGRPARERLELTDRALLLSRTVRYGLEAGPIVLG